MRTHENPHSAAALAHTHHVTWKNALGSVFGAASRVHHYRDLHTRMLRDALCEMDCGATRTGCNDE